MRLLSFSKVRLMLVVFVAAIMLGSGIARADFGFGKPTNLGSIVNGPDDVEGVSISFDGLELYFASDRPNGYGSYDLWVTTRVTTDDDWGEPINLGSVVNSEYACATPSISSDGLNLFFSDSVNGPTMPNGRGFEDIWVVTRETKNDEWSAPINLGSPVSRYTPDYSPSVSADGLSLYFSRFTDPNYYDLYVSTRATVNDPWDWAVNLGSMINSTSLNEITPSISADELALFFCSTFQPLTIDMWVTTRTSKDDDWNPPSKLPINISLDVYPSISSDGSTLYFTSEREGGFGQKDIYVAPVIPVVDLKSDGKIDINDLAMFIDHYHRGTNAKICDFGPMPWGDGVVDEADLEILMSYWGQEFEDPTLIAHWKLDETEGAVAHDSASDIKAELYGDPVWQPTDGMVDGALMLDGVDDLVGTWNIPDIHEISGGKLSVFAWIKGGAPGQVVVSQFHKSTWLMADASQGYLMTDLKEAGDTAQPLVSEVIITDGNWHRVGITWDGLNRVLYVDDIAVASDTQTSLEFSTMGLNIGCGPNETSGTFFSGLIDDVRVYNRAIMP